MQQKLVPDLFIILVNNPKQPLNAKTILKVKYFERGLLKALKKVTSSFFRTQSLSIEKITKSKRGLELVTSRYSGYKTS